jgi:hypothetical protein
VRDHATARALAIFAAVMAGAVTALYWHVIIGQGDQNERRPQLVALSLVAAVSLLLVSTAMRGVSTAMRGRVVQLLLLSLGSSTLVIWAVVGAMSIGVLLLPAAIVSLMAANKTSELVPTVSAWFAVSAGAAAALGLAVVVFGFS